MPKRNPFSREGSLRSSFGSNALTTQGQGGGDKKAGFPYQVGRSWQTSLVLHSTAPRTGQCCKLNDMKTLPISWSRGVRQSRPIGVQPGQFYYNYH
jgi:hypothetical protein